MTHLTFEFTAKRTLTTDWRIPSLPKVAGYKIPLLDAKHVVSPRTEWDTTAILMFGPSRATDDIRRSRQRTMLKGNGLDTVIVFESDASENVVITPQGSGFMARIRLTLELRPKVN